MKLIAINSAAYTATDGLLDLTLTADLEDGNGEQSLPFGWQVGDPYGIGPQVDAWMEENPDFPIAKYIAPPIAPQVSPIDKLTSFLNANPDVKALLK